MERVCFGFEIFEGKEEEYKKRHDEIWPEMITALQESGFRNYTLFRKGTNIVGYFEAHPDAATATAAMAKTDVNVRWGEWFKDVIVSLNDDSGNLKELQEVWHLD